MSRTPEQIVAAMAAAARLATFAEHGSWYDALFKSGNEFSLPGEPDRALLRALADEYSNLDIHADSLPDLMHVAWLEEILRIPRLPVVPDRVVAQFTVDPKLAPAVVPVGTVLRGGKDAFKNERRYVTLDALTAHGAALVAVRSLTPGGTVSGLPGIANSAPQFPLTPSAGPNAPHTLRIHSPALAFDGGTLGAKLIFGGATAIGSMSAALWRYSRADGSVSPTTGGSVSGNAVTVTLSGSCGAPPGQTPWIECVIPATVPVPEAFSFTWVKVQVTSRTPYVPQAAYYNEGALDITKEFQPFGAVAKRGDAFYLRSDEAFSKALNTVTITVTMQSGGGTLSASVGGSGIPKYTSDTIIYYVDQAKAKLGSSYSDVAEEFGLIGEALSDQGDPSVRWQRRVGGEWVPMGSSQDSFGSITATVADSTGSQRFAVGGQEGNYVRAFLHQGDFGWTAYQEMVAAFATEAVAGGTPTMQPPPVPPVATSIKLSYTTLERMATLVESTSGWRHAVKPSSGAFYPFRRAVSELGATGMVAVGLDLPDSALGSSVSVYFDIESASPCGATDPVDAHWEWWKGTGWEPLAVADASRQLREAGLLRFVAPLNWPTGCADTSAETGRWIRLVTFAPDRIGDLRDVLVDAVIAEFVSRAPDPQTDPSSATALPPGTIKGTLSPIRGVKKVTNLASVRGRGPESQWDYQTRASARARHRDRAIIPWDYEQRVALAFPEVAAVLCLPHTNSDGDREPGQVGLVVIPDRPYDPAPRPSVSLVERVLDAIAPARPIGAEVAVLCPLYVTATVVATISLRRGIAALTGKEAITTALETFLHPTGTYSSGGMRGQRPGGAGAIDPAAPVSPTRWGRSLYASTLIAFLERHPSVDVVTSFELRNSNGTPVEVIEVDPCRGLYNSSASHQLTCVEQL